MRRVSALILAGTVLTGCGSSEPTPATRPTLPALIAERLAERSDRVAAALTSGDGCTALDQAHRLQSETVAAINSGRIPGPFQEHLASAVTDLVGRITCAPPVEEQHGNGKGEGKGKHKGKHEGDD